MRRLSLILLAVALVGSVVAYAVDVNIGLPADQIVADGLHYIYSTPTTNPASSMPSSYTIYAKDQTDDFYIRRYLSDGTIESDYFYVPAGKSILFPAPGTYVATGNWRHTIEVYGMAAGDTIFVLPWGR